MNKQEIQRHKRAFDQAIHQLDDSGIEYCFARELMTLLDYDRWENFSNTVNKARIACENSGIEVSNHFRDVTKMVALGFGAKHQVAEFLPTVTIAAKNNESVRDVLAQRGIKPEQLPAEQDLQKLQRKVVSAEKKLIKQSALPKSGVMDDE